MDEGRRHSCASLRHKALSRKNDHYSDRGGWSNRTFSKLLTGIIDRAIYTREFGLQVAGRLRGDMGGLETKVYKAVSKGFALRNTLMTLR